MKLKPSLLLFSAAFFQSTSAEGGFEWAGTFDLADDLHAWIMQKVNGEYADPSMRLVVFATSDTSNEGLEAVEPNVEALMKGTDCTVVQAEGSFGPCSTNGACFQLTPGTDPDSRFEMDTTDLAGMAVFAQHFPTEFERDQHYLQDSAGTDIEPVAQEGSGGHHHHHDENKPTCGCVKDEYGFAVDCTAKAAIIDSISFLKSGGCADDCSSDTCQKAWYIVQTHHDYCAPDALPQNMEDDFHDFDEKCESCQIVRGFIEGADNCPTPNCEDESGNQAYLYLMENGCSTGCAASEACKERFLTLFTVHDRCDHAVLSTASEEGLHDFEDHCAGIFCNAPGSKEDQLTCKAKEVQETDGATTYSFGTVVVLVVGAALFMA